MIEEKTEEDRQEEQRQVADWDEQRAQSEQKLKENIAFATSLISKGNSAAESGDDSPESDATRQARLAMLEQLSRSEEDTAELAGMAMQGNRDAMRSYASRFNVSLPDRA